MTPHKLVSTELRSGVYVCVCVCVFYVTRLICIVERVDDRTLFLLINIITSTIQKFIIILIRVQLRENNQKESKFFKLNWAEPILGIDSSVIFH